ncbi:MAG TPA: hypothetical protein EYG97_01630 [Arcobacter sp.]|nr:hypothetical protein [Arcobacter sp.]HIP55705.1 hypothetical protein [Arcobacter sp.]
MNNDTKNIKKIIECIQKEIDLFICQSMSLEIIEKRNDIECIGKRYFSTITLEDKGLFTITMNIDDDLFDVFFNNFFDCELEENEKEELIDALPSEIINTIVGLAIKDFPEEFENLQLGLPSLESINGADYQFSNTFSIKTNNGSLCFHIVYSDN